MPSVVSVSLTPNPGTQADLQQQKQVSPENRKIRVGIYENTPLVFTENGIVNGIYIEILEYIAEKEGWQIEYILSTFPELIDSLKKGEIDLMVAIAYSEEREKYFDFNRECVLSNWAVIYERRGEKMDSILDLDGKRVAGVRDDIYFTNLMTLAEKFDLNCTFVAVEGDYDEVLRAVENGEVDAGVVSRLYGDINEQYFDVERTNIIFSPVELKFAVPKGKNPEILATIDKYLVEMKNREDSVYYSALDKWLGGEEKFRVPEWVVWSLVVLGVISFFAFYRSFLLERELNKKRKELEKEVSERMKIEQKYQDLWENANDYLYLLDLDGNILKANRAAREAFGYTEEEIKKLNIRDIVDEKYLPLAFEKIREKLKTGEPTEPYEILCRAKDGREIWVEIRSAPIIEDGKIVGVQGVARDITARKQLEKRLSETNELLRLANRILRHDLINALTAVIGLLDGFQELKDENLLSKMRDRIEQSIKTIKNMRELDTVTSAERRLKPMKIREVVEEIAKNYTIEIKIHGDCTVLADEVLYSVFDNLISNAIIHGKTGKIDIFVEPRDKYCVIKVSDYGVGIPDEIKDEIFQEGKSFGSGEHTGLGLFIVKKAIERYGGTIHVEDNVPRGAVFVIKLRRANE